MGRRTFGFVQLEAATSTRMTVDHEAAVVLADKSATTVTRNEYRMGSDTSMGMTLSVEFVATVETAVVTAWTLTFTIHGCVARYR